MGFFKGHHLSTALVTTVSVLFVCAGARGDRIEFKKVERGVVDARLDARQSDSASRREALKQLFIQAGCSGANLTDQEVKGSDLPNIVCTLPGKTGSTIIIGANFDLKEPSQGAVNNWSGAALLPSLYEGINKTERNHTFVFVGFTDKESGRKGSRAFAKALDRNQVKAMINLESLGLDSTKAWADDSNKELSGLLAGVAQAVKLPVTGMTVSAMGQGDGESFASRGVKTMTIHSINGENLDARQPKNDRLEAINREAYYNTYSLTLAYLAFLDLKLE